MPACPSGHAAHRFIYRKFLLNCENRPFADPRAGDEARDFLTYKMARQPFEAF